MKTFETVKAKDDDRPFLSCCFFFLKHYHQMIILLLSFEHTSVSQPGGDSFSNIVCVAITTTAFEDSHCVSEVEVGLNFTNA